MAKKRNGEVLFTGSAWSWGKKTGSQGVDHPFRRKSDRMVKAFERRMQEEAELTVGLLESFGVPVGNLEHEGQLEGGLEELDRFVAEHGLEHRGIDVVLDRFERARYDHNEDPMGQEGE